MCALATEGIICQINLYFFMYISQIHCILFSICLTKRPTITRTYQKLKPQDILLLMRTPIHQLKMTHLSPKIHQWQLTRILSLEERRIVGMGEFIFLILSALGLAESNSSDDENLVELEGNKLEQNLWELRCNGNTQVNKLNKPTMYDQLCDNPITEKQWKSAETGLGYSCTRYGSTHTQERCCKETQNRWRTPGGTKQEEQVKQW